MRRRKITPPTTHPHVVELNIDPVDFHRLENFAEDGHEFRILHCDHSQPDVWTVHIGCASRAVADGLEEGWG